MQPSRQSLKCASNSNSVWAYPFDQLAHSVVNVRKWKVFNIPIPTEACESSKESLRTFNICSLMDRALMNDNGGWLLGLYDELTTFLTQINLYRACGLTDSHDLGVFLQLYNGYPWTRKTGMEAMHTQLLKHTKWVGIVLYTVTGDADFTMEHTSLTVAEFTQPTVARGLIEMKGSAEKGLAHRFLWIYFLNSYFHS